MLGRIIILFIYLFLQMNIQAQEIDMPTKSEMKSLDSLVMNRLEKISCFENDKKYKFLYIFTYQEGESTISKHDFLDQSFISKVDKKYLKKKDLLPHSYPDKQYSLFNHASLQKDSLKAIDSLLRIGALFNIELYRQNVDTSGCILFFNEVFIMDDQDNFVAEWTLFEDWPVCPCGYYRTVERELIKYLLSSNYKVIFHLDYSAFFKYFVIDNKGIVHFLFYSTKENKVEKISMEELVNNRWEELHIMGRSID